MLQIPWSKFKYFAKYRGQNQYLKYLNTKYQILYLVFKYWSGVFKYLTFRSEIPSVSGLTQCRCC